MRIRERVHPAAVILPLLAFAGSPFVLGSEDLPRIKPGARTGFSNGGWSYDRYPELKPLAARSQITVADLKGPGIIRHIHTTRHFPKEIMTRGIVLEIWFDAAKEPAVLCPLGDFFGDGCNGKSKSFSSRLIECAPWSYNCYFPMPFAERARVILRNDTDKDAMNYSYVEWESLSAWEGDLGYFHASYRRKCFQLTKDSDETFFEVRGSGHLLGRQYSVVTDEPLFRGFNVVMEGNNEVDIDGEERRLDYLGTEDSFTFSWGFQETYTGLRSGMPLVEPGDVNRLSIYRFHDHMPIRFNKSLKWHIDWRYEKGFTGNPKWTEAAGAGGCRVDYAAVHYWYQSDPGGFSHEPLEGIPERQLSMLSRKPVDLGSMLAALEVDPKLENDFGAGGDVERVRVLDAYPRTHPFWIDRPQPKGGHPGNPNPGKQGILAVHAKDSEAPCFVLRKVALPEEKGWVLRVTVSGDPYEAPGKSDFLLAAGIHDGKEMKWLGEEVIDAGSPPSEKNWRTLRYPLDAFAGKTVGIVLRVSYGGPNGVTNEEAFFDEISVVRE